jgi:hypothetical protein
MKRKTFSFIFIAAATMLMFSCVIKQEIYFKKDFSGSYKYTYDFTEYVSYMASDEEGSDSLMMKNEDFEEYLTTVRTALKEINGISDVKIVNDADNGLVYFSYNFTDVTALNSALKYSSYMDTEPLEDAPYFVQKKKTLTYIRHAQPQEEVEEGEEDTSYMNDMFKWEYTIEFEAEVKKFDVQKDTAVTISSNNRKFVEGGNIFDVTAKESKWVFKTK